MQERTKTHLVSGGHKGTEAEFGRCAEKYGVPQTTISFEGHSMTHENNVETLNDEQLTQGDVSMAIVFERLGRRFVRGKGIRRVIQSMFHIVNRGHHLFAIGWVQSDGTVKGGTGWGVELAKFFNRDLHVFDQETNTWQVWNDGHFVEEEAPTIPDTTFSATGTRNLTPEGEKAIQDLFERSFTS